MESRIEELIAKYWEGETSLQEESDIKDYFNRNPSLTPEGRYFAALTGKTKSKRSFTHPGKPKIRPWMSVAASLVLGTLVAFLVIRDAQQTRQFVVDDPQEAYEITRKALFMVSSGLNEGSVYSGELKKINNAEKIVNELEK